MVLDLVRLNFVNQDAAEEVSILSLCIDQMNIIRERFEDLIFKGLCADNLQVRLSETQWDSVRLYCNYLWWSNAGYTVAYFYTHTYLYTDIYIDVFEGIFIERDGNVEISWLRDLSDSGLKIRVVCPGCEVFLGKM